MEAREDKQREKDKTENQERKRGDRKSELRQET